MINIYKNYLFVSFHVLFMLSLFTACNTSTVKTAEIVTDGRDSLSISISENIFKHKRDTLSLNKYIQQSKAIGYTKGVIQATDLLGLVYRQNNDYSRSIQNHKQALSMAINSSDTIQIFFALNNLGTVYRRIDDWVEATKCYHSVLEYIGAYSKDTQRRQKSKAVALNGLANVYLLQNKSDDAITYLQRALVVENQLNSWRGQAINYLCIGGVFNDLNSIDSALCYYNKSLQLNVNNNSKVGEAICYLNIGGMYFNTGDNSKALLNYEKSLQICDSINNYFYGSSAALSIGQILLDREEYNKAKNMLLKAYEQAKQIDSKSTVASAAELLSKIYDKETNYKLALQWYTLCSKTRNLVLNKEKSEKLSILNTRFQLSEKEKIISNQKNELQIIEYDAKKFSIIAISIFVLSALLFLVFVLIVRQKRIKQKSVALQLEHKLLRSQMNPHFIFNSLTSIQNYMYKRDSINAGRLLGLFASLMRSVLENSTKEFVTIEEEQATIENYLKLEQIRANNSFSYMVNISHNIEKEFEYIPPMLIQPFIENSIKHGVADINYKGEIVITISKDVNCYNIEITDNGNGFDISKMYKHKSFALKIFNQRLTNIYKTSNKSFKVGKLDGEKGSKIYFNLPLNLN